jgi:hypothetical protein
VPGGPGRPALIVSATNLAVADGYVLDQGGNPMPTQASRAIQLTEREEALLKTGIVLWFGSTRPDGRPHIVPV